MNVYIIPIVSFNVTTIFVQFCQTVLVLFRIFVCFQNQNSYTIHIIYTFFSYRFAYLHWCTGQVPAYLKKRKKTKKKPHFLRFVYTTTTFLLWMKLNINKKRYWYSVIKMKYVSFYIFFLVSNFLIFISCYPYNTVAINVCFCLKSVTINLNWFDFYLCLF